MANFSYSNVSDAMDWLLAQSVDSNPSSSEPQPAPKPSSSPSLSRKFSRLSVAKLGKYLKCQFSFSFYKI